MLPIQDVSDAIDSSTSTGRSALDITLCVATTQSGAGSTGTSAAHAAVRGSLVAAIESECAAAPGDAGERSSCHCAPSKTHSIRNGSFGTSAGGTVASRTTSPAASRVARRTPAGTVPPTIVSVRPIVTRTSAIAPPASFVAPSVTRSTIAPASSTCSAPYGSFATLRSFISPRDPRIACNVPPAASS